MQKTNDPIVQLAEDTIASYVTNHTVPAVPEALADEQAAVFVSLKKNGELRGCIGTILPYYKNIGEEIIHNAVSASTRDPRFPAVKPEELDDITVSVDVLTKPEPAYSLDELDPKRYGVIVVNGARHGVLLPDLEGVDTPQQQVAIAMQKAGIGMNEEIGLERFEVVRHV